jgi:hypothetical protein
MEYNNPPPLPSRRGTAGYLRGARQAERLARRNAKIDVQIMRKQERIADLQQAVAVLEIKKTTGPARRHLTQAQKEAAAARLRAYRKMSTAERIAYTNMAPVRREAARARARENAIIQRETRHLGEIKLSRQDIVNIRANGHRGFRAGQWVSPETLGNLTGGRIGPMERRRVSGYVGVSNY